MPRMTVIINFQNDEDRTIVQEQIVSVLGGLDGTERPEGLDWDIEYSPIGMSPIEAARSLLADVP